MENKERATVKEAIMQRLSAEVDLWLDKEPSLTSGYDYETELTSVAQRMGKIVLEESLGAQPRSRNAKKKFSPALGK